MDLTLGIAPSLLEKLFNQLEDVSELIDECASEIQAVSAEFEDSGNFEDTRNLKDTKRDSTFLFNDPNQQLVAGVDRLEKLVALYTQAAKELKKSSSPKGCNRAWEDVIDDTWLYSRFLDEFSRGRKNPTQRANVALGKNNRIATRTA